jgi:ribosomal protein RSM22 (predicted rRNA methylase)
MKIEDQYKISTIHNYIIIVVLKKDKRVQSWKDLLYTHTHTHTHTCTHTHIPAHIHHTFSRNKAGVTSVQDKRDLGLRVVLQSNRATSSSEGQEYKTDLVKGGKWRR